MNTPVSPFRLINFLIQRCQIERKPLTKQSEFHIVIKPSGIIFTEKKSFQLEMNVKVWEENQRFDASISAIGFFSFEQVHDKESLSNYFYINAPAIIFPYIRSYISALTALSGMEAIVLPPLVLSGLRDELIANTKEFPERNT